MGLFLEREREKKIEKSRKIKNEREREISFLYRIQISINGYARLTKQRTDSVKTKRK